MVVGTAADRGSAGNISPYARLHELFAIGLGRYLVTGKCRNLGTIIPNARCFPGTAATGARGDEVSLYLRLVQKMVQGMRCAHRRCSPQYAAYPRAGCRVHAYERVRFEP
jgi:hypothetical protein